MNVLSVRVALLKLRDSSELHPHSVILILILEHLPHNNALVQILSFQRFSMKIQNSYINLAPMTKTALPSSPSLSHPKPSRFN